jgi:predicted dehydrogenase
MSATRDGSLGLAVVGTGTIGALRARIAALNPIVGYLSVCDIDADRAREVSSLCDADAVHCDAVEAIGDPAVDAVIVATSEHSHYEPAMTAIQAGKPVLIEKPLTLDPAEAREIASAGARAGVPVGVGFTQRYRRRYQSAKQHLTDGYLGDLTTVTAKIFITRAVAESVIRRAPGTTPAINTLTYCVDLLLWYAEGRRPASVYARWSRGEISERYGAPDATWAIVTFEDGLVANLGVSWEPPRPHPANVASMEVDLFGRAGMLEISDDHRDVLLVSDEAIPSAYPPHVAANAALLGSAMPGDWAIGRFFGPMKDETDAFLEAAAKRALPAGMADAHHGLEVLLLTRAIDDSARAGAVIELAAGPPAAV